MYTKCCPHTQIHLRNTEINRDPEQPKNVTTKNRREIETKEARRQRLKEEINNKKEEKKES